MEIPTIVTDNPSISVLIVGGILEFILRKIPTKSDRSPINFVKKVLDYVISNKKIGRAHV